MRKYIRVAIAIATIIFIIYILISRFDIIRENFLAHNHSCLENSIAGIVGIDSSRNILVLIWSGYLLVMSQTPFQAPAGGLSCRARHFST